MLARNRVFYFVIFAVLVVSSSSCRPHIELYTGKFFLSNNKYKMTLNGSGVLSGLIQKGVPLRVGDCRRPWTCYVRARLLLEMCLITEVCCVLHVVSANLLDLLETSIAEAVKKGDPTADAMVHLLPICPPTDNKAKDLMPITASGAPSGKPTPPPTTSNPQEQAAATSAAGGQPVSVNMDASVCVNVLQSNVSADLGEGPDVVVTFCRRVPAAMCRSSQQLGRRPPPPSQ